MNTILEFIKQPWSWYISGLLITVVMLILIFWGKTFGFSSNLRTICTIASAGKRVKFFDFDWRAQRWNLLLFVGGLFVGFGSLYAGGCTSGHAISDLSNLQLPSLIAVIGFFIGGLIMTHLLLPLIL